VDYRVPEDDDAARIWHHDIGVPSEKNLPAWEAENFWAMGDTGPCVHVPRFLRFREQPMARSRCVRFDLLLRTMGEIWNLVFMQYNRDTGGTKSPLPSPSIDTGMGLERITTILQEKATNYDTDLFQPLLDELSLIANKNTERIRTMRLDAHHRRSCPRATLVAENGQYPRNERGATYCVRSYAAPSFTVRN